MPWIVGDRETGTAVPIQAPEPPPNPGRARNRHNRAAGTDVPGSAHEARTPPPLFSVGDELATRAGLDPAWDAVLAVYLAGRAEWPEPFRPRTPYVGVPWT